MSKFTDFMKTNTKPDYYEFAVGTRLVDGNGDPLLFKIKGDMALDAMEKMEERCRIKDKKGKVLKLDGVKLMRSTIKAFCVEPNFNSADEMEAVGVATPDAYIDALLTSAEVMKLCRLIKEYTGIGEDVEDGKDINDLIEEAKN